MEMSNSWGALIPLWIICAPLVGALLELGRTPKPQVRYDSTPSPAPLSSTAAYGRPA
ncbi:hypothetical protein [Rubrivivax gelatinosus]|uniref:hypothetical protein n=1 Tax=Rubrivivax gelatinosus TaxID=28068 RepID=UPI0019064FAB|nr:hypothetical protein [Rubrivivax gelatinosus]